MKNILLIGLVLFLSACSVKENSLTEKEREFDKFIETEAKELNKNLLSLSEFEKEYPTEETCACDYNQFTFAKDKNISELKLTAELVWKYAIMSNNAYKIDEKSQVQIPGWKRIKRFEDMSDTGFSADLYESTISPKRVVIAFRGTDELKDFKTNLSLGERRQYDRAERLYKRIKKEYGNDVKIDVTGHSLGGGLAMHISLLYKNVDSYVFNSSPRVFDGGKYDKNGNRFISISESGEILSLIRKVFRTIKKIDPKIYRYNFLAGHSIAEHSIMKLARCLYASSKNTQAKYNESCKKPNCLRYLF